MQKIEKLKLINFKKFKNTEIVFNNDLNILIGDNESGKSTVLNAIDYTLSGSRNKIETLGIESLLNKNIVSNFLDGDKKIKNLPILCVEIYLSDTNNEELSGKHNSLNKECEGLRLICEPDTGLTNEIIEVLKEKNNFPYEYYSINFKTFGGHGFTGYKKPLNHILIDNTQINNEYAMKKYISSLYRSRTTDIEVNRHRNAYRAMKDKYKNEVLNDLNSRDDINYDFAICTNSKSNLETDLSITEEGINIEHKGKGKQCFIKTQFALEKGSEKLNIVLIEEPENHLSHGNMKKLIEKISRTKGRQIFIATHSSLVSTRLNLQKAILLNSSSDMPISLKDLEDDTSKFFMKAPNTNILEFVLSRKNILVEGNAEYILIKKMFEKSTEQRLDKSDIHVISVGGLSFKRYLKVAKLLKIKTAVITDNDNDYLTNCEQYYQDYNNDSHIEIFYSKDNKLRTFEYHIYEENKDVCDAIFNPTKRSVLEYMLDPKNKAECAFKLLNNDEEINTPQYIKAAFQWIKE